MGKVIITIGIALVLFIIWLCLKYNSVPRVVLLVADVLLLIACVTALGVLLLSPVPSEGRNVLQMILEPSQDGEEVIEVTDTSETSEEVGDKLPEVSNEATESAETTEESAEPVPEASDGAEEESKETDMASAKVDKETEETTEEVADTGASAPEDITNKEKGSEEDEQED